MDGSNEVDVTNLAAEIWSVVCQPDVCCLGQSHKATQRLLCDTSGGQVKHWQQAPADEALKRP